MFALEAAADLCQNGVSLRSAGIAPLAREHLLATKEVEHLEDVSQ